MSWQLSLPPLGGRRRHGSVLPARPRRRPRRRPRSPATTGRTLHFHQRRPPHGRSPTVRWRGRPARVFPGSGTGRISGRARTGSPVVRTGPPASRGAGRTRPPSTAPGPRPVPRRRVVCQESRPSNRLTPNRLLRWFAEPDQGIATGLSARAAGVVTCVTAVAARSHRSVAPLTPRPRTRRRTHGPRAAPRAGAVAPAPRTPRRSPSRPAAVAE